MRIENESPKQYVDRIVRIFGRREPVGVRLRGDGKGISFHEYEIRLIDNLVQCRSLYRNLGIQDEAKARKHLEGQERIIYRLAYDFDIDIEPQLKSGRGNYEFIPWPDRAETFYAMGLADKLMFTDMNEVPYLLDFQYFNHVKVEKFNEVRYLQTLKFYVRHFLVSEVAVFDERKLAFLDEWIYRHVSQLNDDRKTEFFWYPEAFRWKRTDSDGLVVEMAAGSMGLAQDGSQQLTNANVATEEELPSDLPDTDEPVKFQTLCSDDELMRYFDLLRQKNPKNNRPYLNDDAIDWLIGYFFGDRQKHSLKSRPEFEINMTNREIMFFVYHYSTVISPGGKSDESAPLGSTVKILTIGFKSKFSGKAEGYAKTISGKVRGLDTDLTRLLTAKRVHSD
jgi:hypothetical protein